MGGIRKTVQAGLDFVRGCLRIQRSPSADRSGSSPQSRPAMWWLGRVFRGFSKSGAWRRQRSSGAERRDRDPCRDNRDVWCRAPLHASRGQPRSWRKARRPHAVVGGVHPQARRGDQCQPIAGQQGGRADDHHREVTRCDGQSGEHELGRRSEICGGRYSKRVRLHGYTRFRSGGCDGAGRRGSTSSASPQAAAACSAANPRRPSRSRPIRICFSAWKRTWTSTAAQSWMAMRPCKTLDSGFSSASCGLPRVNEARASNTMSVLTSLRPGQLARPFKPLSLGGRHG